MTETEFWADLSYRVSRELRVRSDNRLRFLWCDGFIPDDIQKEADRLVGYAHISEDDGARFEQYRFQIAPFPAGCDNWADVLTQLRADWLSIERDSKTLEIRLQFSD